jgi:oleate hydratase
LSADRKAWIIGSGIGLLAAAAFMIRDAGMSGHNITIFETLAVPSGRLDGSVGKAKSPELGPMHS